MGFKHISLKELETKLSPAFIGHPIKHIEEISELEKDLEEEQKISSFEVISDVLIRGNEALEYQFDEKKKLKEFSGSGFLSIINNSKKDRIWDVRVKLDKTDKTNIGKEDHVKLGNFEPQSNKKINYMITEREDLVDTLKVEERIDVLDLDLHHILDIDLLEESEDNKKSSEEVEEKKDKDAKKEDESLSKKEKIQEEIPELKEPEELKQEEIEKIKIKEEEEKEKVKNEIEETFNFKIQEANKAHEKTVQKYEDATEKMEEWEVREDELKQKYKAAKSEYKDAEKAKKKALRKEFGLMYSIKKHFTELDEEEQKVKDEIDKEYDPKIEELRPKFEEAEAKYENAQEKHDHWKSRSKELKKKCESLEEKIENLKEQKSKTLEERLDSLSDEIEAEFNTVDDKVAEMRKRALEKKKKLLNALKKEEEKRRKEAAERKAALRAERERKAEKARRERAKRKAKKATKDLVLLYDKLNKIKFDIIIENISDRLIRNIRVGKKFIDEFSNFQFKSEKFADLEFKKGILYSNIDELEPGEKAQLTILTEIHPTEKNILGTGEIQVSYIFEDDLVSGLDVEDFSAYSHVMHAIKKKEKETAPNMWDSYIIFKNNSDYKMELRSIVVLDKNREEKYLDYKDKKEILPGEKFISEKWEVENKTEPKFFRKVDYSITHKTEKRSRTTLKFDQDYFELIDFNLSKKFSEKEIKSFEKAEIENLINIKNIGTNSIKGILIEETVPADFIPALDLNLFNVRTPSGKVKLENINLSISPDNDDASELHKLQILINLDEEGDSDYLIDVGEFLEMRYPFKAITPDYNKDYVFPLTVSAFYPVAKSVDNDDISKKYFYKVEQKLHPNDLPKLNIIHKRRDLLIGKEIFPGRELDEFAISILVKNDSNVEVSDIKITDEISESFEFVSSNVEEKIIEDKKTNGFVISFLIDKILPYQDKEIRYYVKKKEDASISYDELESFIFG
ncbi:MAG: hypothetical protein BAJALOKI2v1_20056 [Promethearchaeota archaeon]|nr:MAG: hypothetical protein BAJALOKI2v1_20056 [Candidatus Lokiarchaeota archaeon]